ncbi:MAG: lysyl oxidase family protein [Actinomycetota bacterium]|nr:lysyl oxidase family protein [Actinomycetota bacterium]
MRRIWGAALGALITVGSLGVLAEPAQARHRTPRDLLPDLRMAPMTNFSIEETRGGRRLLRFDSVIVNVGKGRFEARGSRPDQATELMRTSQRVYNTAGRYRTVRTAAQMYYSGDGHDHWHVRDLEQFTFVSKEGGTGVGTLAKHGFCFFDNVPYRLGLPRAPRFPYYSDCGNEGDLRVRMGLSVGWGDLYDARLIDQYVDISDLPDGRYRMTGTADPQRWFKESNPRNNASWVDLDIRGTDVRVLARSPRA